MNPPLLNPSDLTTLVIRHRQEGEPNVYNEREWGEPLPVAVHWVDKQVKRTSIEGTEYTSMAQVMSLEPLQLGDELEKDGRRYVIAEVSDREFFGDKSVFYDAFVRGS